MISEVTLEPKNHLRGLINYLIPPSTPSLSLYIYIPFPLFIRIFTANSHTQSFLWSCSFSVCIFYFFHFNVLQQLKSKVCVCREYWRGVILLLAISFVLFLAFGLTTSGSLLFSSTMINSGGFVCLNYRVIHIHSFSLLLLHGLFPFRVRVGPFILVKDLIKIISLYWPMRQHQDSQTLRLELGWYTVTSFTRKVP
jgi:hypothetical protein